MPWLDHTPLWIIALVLATTLVIAHEAGFWGGRRMGDAKLDAARATVASALTLLGLLTAFTFGAAQERFDLRQRLVVQEANAIETAYLRTQLLPEPWRTTLSHQLLEYADLRVGRVGGDADPGRLSAVARESSARHWTIWRTVKGAVQANPTPTLNAPLVQSMNEMFDLGSSRQAARDARVPITVLRILWIFALASAVLMGLAAAANQRDRLMWKAVLLLMTLAFIVILDLDRPTSGSIRVSQARMAEVVAGIHQNEATSAQSPSPGSTGGVGTSPAR